jgi:uncharacterized protein (PEP-CTERM system associated)
VALKTGWNQFERDEFKGDGFLLELDLSRQLTPQSSLSINAGSRYSTNGDIFRLCQGIQGCERGTQDQQPTDEVFQNDFVAISYAFNRTRTRFSLWVNWSDEDYETENNQDRTVRGIRASVSRDVTPIWSIDVTASYNEREYATVARDDEDMFATLGISIKLGTRTTARIAASRWDRTSNGVENEFDENRYSLMFTYSALGQR